MDSEFDRRNFLKTGVTGGSALLGSGLATGQTGAQFGDSGGGEREFLTQELQMQDQPATVSVSHPDVLIAGIDNLLVCRVNVTGQFEDPRIAVQVTDGADVAQFTRVVPGSFPRQAAVTSSENQVRAEGEAVDGPWQNGRHATFAVTVRPAEPARLSVRVLLGEETTERVEVQSTPVGETATPATQQSDKPGEAIPLGVGPRPERRLNTDTLARTAEKRATLATNVRKFLAPNGSGFKNPLRDAFMHGISTPSTMFSAEAFGRGVGFDGNPANYLWNNYTSMAGTPMVHTSNGGLASYQGSGATSDAGRPFLDYLLGSQVNYKQSFDQLTGDAAGEPLNGRASSAILCNVLSALAREEAEAWRSNDLETAQQALVDQLYILDGTRGTEVDTDRIESLFSDNAQVGVAIGNNLSSETTEFISALQGSERVASRWRRSLTNKLDTFTGWAARTGAGDRAAIGAASRALAGVIIGQARQVRDLVTYVGGDGLFRDVSAGWVNERFVERNDQNNPFLGSRVTFRGVVMLDPTDPPESVSWAPDSVRGRGSATEGEDGDASRLFPISAPTMSTLASDSGALRESNGLILAGIDDGDQRHYDKYGAVPIAPVFAEDTTVFPDVDPAVGAVVEVKATIEWAGAEDPVSGPILRARDAEQVDRIIPEQATPEASVIGLQQRSGATLTDFGATTDYKYPSERSYPTPGSLVWLSDETDQPVSGTLSVGQQRLLVGDVTNNPPWETADGGGEEQQAADFVTVIDKSGSMGSSDARGNQTRLEAARQSVKSLIDFTVSGTRLGVVGFSSSSFVASEFGVVDDSTREQYKSDVDSLGSGGGTSIWSGLEQAHDVLTSTASPSANQTIILLSDGQGDNPDRVSQVVSDIAADGITVHTIGLGGDINRSQLTSIADQTGGRSLFSPTSRALQRLYQQLSTAAQNRTPVTEKRKLLEEGESMSGQAAVDASMDDVQFSLTYPGSTITLDVEKPDGTTLSESDSNVENRVGSASEVWNVENPDAGEWSFTATAEELPRPETANVVVDSDASVTAELYASTEVYDRTGLYKFELTVLEGDEPYAGGSAELTATLGDREWNVDLRDDGQESDPIAKDGIYTGYFHPPQSGTYEFTATLTGGKYDGLERDFSRELAAAATVDNPQRYYDTGDQNTADSGLPLIALVGGGAIAAAGALVGLYRYMQDDDEDGPGGPGGPGGQRPQQPASQPRPPGQGQQPQQPPRQNPPNQGQNQPPGQGQNRPPGNE